MPHPAPTRVLVTHPHSELYGSDRQMLESVSALVSAGWDVVVTVPAPGALAAALRARGASVHVLDVPVLRKSHLSPAGLVRLGAASLRVRPLVDLVRRVDPDVVYVSTLVAPSWVAAARLARVPVVVHVHEAEVEIPRALQRGLAAPLLAARLVLANSRASRDVLLSALPALRGRTQVLYNGVPGPPEAPAPPAEEPGDPLRLVQVGRLSPRKGSDVTVEAVHLLREEGIPVVLDLVGGVYDGYEWFEERLRAQVAAHGLHDVVRFSGFRDVVWPHLAAADVAVVASRVEPFGNVAVEALLARRPLVTTSAQGLAEIVSDGVHGVVVEPDDPAALAAGVRRVHEDWPGARRLCEQGWQHARSSFSPGALHRRAGRRGGGRGPRRPRPPPSAGGRDQTGRVGAHREPQRRGDVPGQRRGRRHRGGGPQVGGQVGARAAHGLPGTCRPSRSPAAARPGRPGCSSPCSAARS